MPATITDPPVTGDGCPYLAAPWRLVVQAWGLANPDARAYGTDTYGADVYGDGAGAGTPYWVDLTYAVQDIVIIRGTVDGAVVSTTDQLTVELYDPAGTLFDFTHPQTIGALSMGTLLRVGLFDPADPAGTWTPHGMYRIDTIRDVHDQPPRIITVEAFSALTDLVTTVTGWDETTSGTETLVDRVTRLATAAGFPFTEWGPLDTDDLTQNPQLGTDVQLAGVTVQAIARARTLTATSGVLLDTSRTGQLRLRTWPLGGTTPADTDTVVTDCWTRDELFVPLTLADGTTVLTTADGTWLTGSDDAPLTPVDVKG